MHILIKVYHFLLNFPRLLRPTSVFNKNKANKMSAPTSSPSLNLDPKFIEEVSNKVTEHEKRRLLSSSSSDENNAEPQYLRILVAEVVTKAVEGI